jgi:hypothetical protein
MKTIKEYIVKTNQTFGFKLMFFIGNLFGVKVVYQASEVAGPLPVEKQEVKQAVIGPLAKNLDIIPRYYHLTPKMITSLYNLISVSYWDEGRWNGLLDRAYRDDIHSQLGFALREAMCDEVCFPAIN